MRRRPARTRARLLVTTGATVTVVAAVTGGCGWQGLNSLPLPGTAGHGDDAYSVVIEMPDASTVDRNSRVLVSDVTVGRVADLGLRGDHAVVTVVLDGDVELPENATAKIGQTSLLGSTHIELAPPVVEQPRGTLQDGSVIPIERAGEYPSTEETLASVSLVLTGGGLSRIHDITSELDAALSGREDAVRALLGRLDAMLTVLDEQKSDIVRAIDGLDAFTREVAARDDVLDEAVTAMQPALEVLDDRRADLTRTLDTLGTLGATATRIVDGTREDLVAELHELEPVLASLADADSALTESSRYLLTYPFPIDTYQNVVRGDYANGEVTLDLTLSTLDNALLLGTPLEGSLFGLEALLGRVSPTSIEPVRGIEQLLAPRSDGPR